MTEDVIKDVKRHSYYLKPGERRRVKQALAQKHAEKRFERTRIKSHQRGPPLPPSNAHRMLPPLFNLAVKSDGISALKTTG
jgi:hypothetical protein